MMIKDIMDGVSNKLHELFGNCEIYGDTDVVQGLSPPCFFIAVLEPRENCLIGNRRFRQYPIDVEYFPAVDKDNMECLNVADSLFEGLEYIILSNGDLLHGTNKHYEIIDSVLHFRINYNVFLRNVEQKDLMRDVYTKVGIRGEVI